MPSSESSVSSTPVSLGGTSRGRPPERSTARTYIAGTSAASSSHAPNRAGVTYVVMPTTGLATLEQPLAFPARHRRVEEPLLDARVVQVVLDDVVAEYVTRHRAHLERGDRLAQRRRKPLRVRLVGVALERRARVEPRGDAVQPCRD